MMKTKAELQPLIEQIASDASPVGMDAVYVHALILDKLTELERRLAELEQSGWKRAPTSESRSTER